MEEEEKYDQSLEYSINYLKMALTANQREIPDRPDAYGKNIGSCGDSIEIFLTIQNDYILSVAYDMNGCLNTRAAANTVVMMAEGKRVQEAWEITPDRVIEYLETMPAESEHCAQLAVGALYKALANHQEMNRHSWKKLYQKR